MTPQEHRTNDRTSYYTMKTPGLVSAAGSQVLSHSRSNSQSYGSCKTTTSPMASPRILHSGGQPRPSKLSPGIARGGAHDARTTSPNYFGLAVDPVADPRDSAMLPRENWSSPSSSVKSFATAIPKQLPLDANPEFEAFRRQVDANRARAAFNLSASHFNIASGGPHTPPAPAPSALQRPRPPKWHTQGGDGSDFPWPRLRLGDASVNKGDRDADGFLQEDSAYVSADSKRSSAVSLNLPSLANVAKQETPPPQQQSPFPNLERGGFNLAIPKTAGRSSLQTQARVKTDSPPPSSLIPAEAGAKSQAPTGGPTMMAPAELKELLENDEGATILLLDLRVSPQFAQSRVQGALNLCIPTTLLKRATFNLQKLQQTFQADGDQDRFANWRNASHLVVYDASSSDKRDAVSALNMIKKFTNEGYAGPTSILCGGFNAFAEAYPSLIDRSSGWPSPGLSLGSSSVSGGLRPNIPPVIGGVLLPNASNNLTPFFNNIRQNQDLVDGVGRIEVGVPSGLAGDSLPRWLREAAEASDGGQKVSDKFLRIERLEQSRMREAYSISQAADVVETAREAATVAKVQLSGIEKGGKNRYKDILPFEHARVRLQGRPEGGCDYVNASHIQAKRSYKRYIASQGPLPATFEDFWSVIWDHDVRVIVMLTAESEGGQLKCHPYWKGNDFGSIKLRVLSEKKVSLDIDSRRSPSTTSGTTTDGCPGSSAQALPSDACSLEGARRRANTTTVFTPGPQTAPGFNFNPPATGVSETPHVVIRKFALSHAAHPFSPIREITQLHYPSWPDFGTPAQPSHLLALVELANVMQRGAAPLDVPGTLASASISQQYSDPVAADGAAASSSRRGVDRGSSAGTRRSEAETVPLGWYDGPESNEHARPMLVHCSAGCGRTGAFCTVDSVIDMLKRQRQHMMEQSSNGTSNQAQRSATQTGGSAGGAQGAALQRDLDGDISMGERTGGNDYSLITKKHDEHRAKRPKDDPAGIDTSWLNDDSIDLIAQTVEDFRSQRLSMVQSLRQFVLCYETVLEWIARLQKSDGGHDPRKRARSGSLTF